MSRTQHAITALRLENFRNYRSLNLTFSPEPVVLRGVNGAGKTNILEALSLLLPGRGFRQSRLREMDHEPRANEQFAPSLYGNAWVVAAEVMTGNETIPIATGRDPESSAEKRIIHIEGERVKSASQLTQYVSLQWLTPAMDQVFVSGGSPRRALLDRIVYGFFPEHSGHVSAYEKAMRDRNRVLTDRHLYDAHWLGVLEQQLAEHAVAITLARQQVIAFLSATLEESLSHFPRALIQLEGTLEHWLSSGQSALDSESAFSALLAQQRSRDAARGRAGEGPHRSQFRIQHREKNREAAQCSTGEQKALLLSLVLSAAKARRDWCGIPPILLLDEVIAHLDVDKRASLFDLIRATAIQAWMTGTDAADFQGLEGFSTILEIDSGTVKIC